MATKKTKQPTAPATADLRQEIATVARDPWQQMWGGIIRPRDETLATRGGSRGIWIYEDLKRDGAVVRGINKRVLGLLSRPLQIEAASDAPADVAAAEAFTRYAKRARMNKLTRSLWDANIKGFAVVEALWGEWQGLLVPLQFKARDQRRFVFDEDANLRLLTREDMLKGVDLPARKFIVHRFGDSDENPYGLGLGSQLFWPVLFKRQGISFWLQFVDKFGSPTVVGKYPAGTSIDQQAELMRAIESIRSATGVKIPEGMLLEYLELKATGNVTTQESLVRYMDEQIDAILGLEASGSKGGGALAAAAIDRREVRVDAVKADDEAISETLQDTLCRWFCEVNFPQAEPPQLCRDTDEPEDLNARATRDKTLFDMGFRLTAEQVQETYGGEYEDIREQQLAQQQADAKAKATAARVAPDAKPLPGQQGGAGNAADAGDGSNVEFAAAGDTFPDQAALDAALNAISANDQQALMAPVLQPLLDLVAKSKDPTALMGKLTDAYPSMDTGKLEELLARMLFVAMIHGQLSANAETAGNA